MLPKRILVGYDGSPEAKKALDWAIDLAKAGRGALIVQHVVAVAPEFSVGGLIDFDALEAQVTTILDEAVEHARAAGVTATKVVSRGDVAAMILREAEARGADVILVGSLGRGRMSRVLMGSVADKLVRNAPIPVLIAR